MLISEVIKPLVTATERHITVSRKTLIKVVNQLTLHIRPREHWSDLTAYQAGLEATHDGSEEAEHLLVEWLRNGRFLVVDVPELDELVERTIQATKGGDTE